MAERVSRETPPAPDVARDVFGARVDRARRYAELLSGPGLERGLIGPREVPRLWDRHLLNCAVVQEAVPAGATVADIGSGAGLPGLVLALARPDLEVTLVEPLLRRCRFLTEAVEELRLNRVTVRRCRAEELAGEMSFDVVTARAVAPLAKLAGWTLPLLVPGGVLLALKGETVEAELREAAPTLRTLGATSFTVREFGAGIVDPVTRVAVVEMAAPRRDAGRAQNGGTRRRRPPRR